MFCCKCGKEIMENSKFCSHCGAPQTEEVTVKPKRSVTTCPICGSTDIQFVAKSRGQRFDKTDACCGYLLCGPLGLLFGVKDEEPAEMVRMCVNCNYEIK